MIKRLQRRFVLIAVGSLAFVWLLLVGVIDLAFFIHTERTTDARLLVLAENEGKFPEKKKPSDFFVDREKKMNAEAPFDMRFFTVSLDEDGTVFAVNTGKIFAISTEDASAYAQVLFEKEKTKGYVDNYKYKRISLKEDPSKEMYIFLDY